MTLESLVKKGYDALTKTVNLFWHRPFLFGVTTGIAATVAPDAIATITGFNPLELQLTTLSVITGLFGPAAYLSYLASRAVTDYEVKGKDITQVHGKTAADRLYHWCLDNAPITSLALGVGSAVAATALRKTGYISDSAAYFSGYLQETALGAFVGQIGAYALQTAEHLRSVGKNSSVVSKITDTIFEHPLAIGSMIGLVSLAHSYEKLIASAHFVRPEGMHTFHQVSSLEALPIFSFFAARNGLYATIGTALAGGIFHSMSRKLIRHKMQGQWHALFGNVDKAIQHQEKVLELPTSLEQRIAHLVGLGNLYLEKAGKTETIEEKQQIHEKGMVQYRKAVRLFDKKSPSFSHFDYFYGALGLKGLFRKIQRWNNKDNDIRVLFLDLLNHDPRAVQDIER
ncbi:hypothetical protein HZB00_01910, partial [Candidatus Woesearchaeota archaeon]|nr:hypothetical protein [Candidatus Woesearchaeota archaeon]